MEYFNDVIKNIPLGYRKLKIGETIPPFCRYWDIYKTPTNSDNIQFWRVQDEFMADNWREQDEEGRLVYVADRAAFIVPIKTNKTKKGNKLI